MNMTPFALERYFAQYEFSVKHQMSSSDCESCTIKELLEISGVDFWDSFMNTKLGYTESLGSEELRFEISKLYPGIDPGSIIVMAPQEAIFLALSAILQKGDHCIVVSPTYQSLFEVPLSLGCSVTRWPLQNNGNQWSLDMQFLDDAITDSTKAIIINFPNNPTGFMPNKEFFKTIISKADKHGIILFSDEMYWQLEHSKESRLHPVCLDNEKGITLSGLSKSYGLPGLRIGWLVIRDKTLFRKVAELKDYTTICNSAASEQLAIAGLRNCDFLLNKNRQIIETNVQKTLDLFNNHRSVLHWNQGIGGSIVFPKFKKNLSAITISQQLIKEKSVLLLPGNLFEMGDHYFRIGLGRKDLPHALSLFSDFLAEKAD
jgi:aspartate/methionine/tyrosine aminotransferase